MDVSIALVILAAGLFAWFVLTGLRWAFVGRGSGQKRDSRSRFHAVSIKVRGSGCEAARSLGRRRYLADEAPQLPLKNCDRANCTCAYVHFDDRRRGERRLWAAATDREDRRAQGQGRRNEDRLGYS